MFIEIAILAILLATFAFIIPPGSGPELVDSVDDPTAGPANEPAVETPSEEAEPSSVPEGEAASAPEGAGDAPEAEELAADPVIPSYGRDNEIEMLRQRADRADRQLQESLAAQRRMAPSAGPGPAPVVLAPLVPGISDEDLDPQTRAVLLGQRQASEGLAAIRAENKELRDQNQQTRARADMAAQDSEAERVVNNLINEIDVFRDEHNPEVAKMVREDVMAGVRAGQVTAVNVAESVLQQARRYGRFIKSTAETPRDKVEAAIERKAQADDSTSLGKPAATPASSPYTKEQEAKMKDQSNPRRFAGLFKRNREKMQAAGSL